MERTQVERRIALATEQQSADFRSTGELLMQAVLLGLFVGGVFLMVESNGARIAVAAGIFLLGWIAFRVARYLDELKMAVELIRVQVTRLLRYAAEREPIEVRDRVEAEVTESFEMARIEFLVSARREWRAGLAFDLVYWALVFGIAGGTFVIFGRLGIVH